MVSKRFPTMFRSFLLALGFISTVQAAAPRPNILFVQVDDLGPGDLGVTWQNARSGTQKFATPHLDAFAGEGARLTQHYAPAPVCAPSRSSLQLGVTQGHANVRDNQFDKVLDNNHTLGSVLRTAGYSTAAIGKWGLGGGDGSGYPGHPQNRGYEYYFGVLEHGDAHSHYPKDTPISGSTIQIEDGTTDVTQQLDKAYSTDLWAARAKKWIIDQHATTPAKPFFLYLGFTAPHARLQVPTQAYPAGWGVNGGLQWTGTPGAVINTASGTVDSYIHPDYASTSWPAAEKRHATMIRRLDDAIYDLEKTLEDLGIAENTLIVFTSDNGAHNEAGSGGSYTQDPKFFGSYGPFEGIKRDMWEGGVRMPALVKWPAGIAAGSVDNVPSQAHDWLATFADLAGVPKPARSDGQSLVSDLTGSGTRKPSVIYSEYNYDGSTPDYPDFTTHRTAIRDEMQFVQIGGYKGVRTNITNHETDDFLIYDVVNDVKEATNLSGQPGVPTQREFKDRVLQVRRVEGGTARSFDSIPVPSLATPPQVKHGLNYQTYSGTYPWVPDFETLTATGNGEATVPDVSVTPAGDSGVLFSGYLRVPADGVYTFYLGTDTGAFVRLHDLQLLDADAGYTAGNEVTTTLPLKAGLHPIHIHYRHAASSAPALSLKWSSTTLAKQEITSASYFVEGTPEPSIPAAHDDHALIAGSNSTAGTPISIDVLSNDYDEDGAPSPLALVSVSAPVHGTAVIDQGKVIYTPARGFFGTDRFTYQVTDGVTTVTGQVSVDVVQPLGSDLWLPFDEKSGAAIHEAGGAVVATLADTSEWTTGHAGGALQFDGSNQQIVIAGGYAPPLGKAARTVSAWIRVPVAMQAESSTWLSYGVNTSGNRFSARIDTGANAGKLRLEVQSGYVVGTRSLADDTWHHVAVVVSDANNDGTTNVTETKLYIDGVLEPISTSSTRAIDTIAGPALTIGGSSHAATYNFAGRLDDVRIDARALTQPEIAARIASASSRNAWLYRYTGNATPTDAAWTSDDDRDGFNVLLEYALGGTPGDRDVIAPVLQTGDGWTFTFNRRRDGLSANAYIVETSSTLAVGDWTPVIDAAPIVSQHPDLPDFDRVTVHLSAASASAGLFARLRVAP